MDLSIRTPTKNRIRSCPCFLVQKVSHNGSLVIYRDQVSFYYANGQEFADARIPFSTITEMIVGTSLASAMNTIEFRVGDKCLSFSGLRDAASIKDLITLLQQLSNRQSDSFGFSRVQTVMIETMVNPTLICSYTIPLPFEKVTDYLETKESYASVLSWMGQEDIAMGDWVEKAGYRERMNQYNRIITVFGRTVIPVTETHRVFVEDGVWTCSLRPDLKKIPYGNSFEAYEHVIVRNNEDSVEFIVKCDIIWYKSPFVKGVIQTTTLSEVQKQFVHWYHQLQQDLLGKSGGEEGTGGSDGGQGSDKGGDEEAKFNKIRRLYKITIIILLLSVLLTIMRWNWPREGWRIGFWLIFKMVVFGFFILVLMFF
jgi:hypothetical protein